MLTLYDFGNSVCCQKVRITLVEKGLTWEARKVDLFKTEQYDPEYLKLNPKGVVPTLVHDGTPVIESTLICEYLDETFPDPPLMPKDPAERARMRLWSKFVDEGLFDGVTELSFSAMFRERMRTMPPGAPREAFPQCRRSAPDRPLQIDLRARRAFAVRAARHRGLRARVQADGADAGRTRAWLLGKSPTLADINLMPFAARLSYLGLLEAWTAGRPRINDWWARVQDWPSFRRGLHDLITGDRVRRDAHARPENPRRRREAHRGVAGQRCAGLIGFRLGRPGIGGCVDSLLGLVLSLRCALCVRGVRRRRRGSNPRVPGGRPLRLGMPGDQSPRRGTRRTSILNMERDHSAILIPLPSAR